MIEALSNETASFVSGSLGGGVLVTVGVCLTFAAYPVAIAI